MLGTLIRQAVGAGGRRHPKCPLVPRKDQSVTVVHGAPMAAAHATTGRRLARLGLVRDQRGLCTVMRVIFALADPVSNPTGSQWRRPLLRDKRVAAARASSFVVHASGPVGCCWPVRRGPMGQGGGIWSRPGHAPAGMSFPACQDGLEARAGGDRAAAVDVDSGSAHAREGDEGAPGPTAVGLPGGQQVVHRRAQATTGAGLRKGDQSERGERRRQWVAAAVGAPAAVRVLPGHQVVTGTAQRRAVRGQRRQARTAR